LEPPGDIRVKTSMSALGHVWTAPFGQGFFGDLRLGRVQVMCPACLRGTRDRWP